MKVWCCFGYFPGQVLVSSTDIAQTGHGPAGMRDEGLGLI